MKKRTIAILVIGLLLVLVVRAVYIRFGRGNYERTEYPKRLNFHFSAAVDSLKAFSHTNGLVYFHPTKGDVNLSKEDRVNKKLKFNGSVRFILPMANGTLAFHSRDLEKYQTRDSLVLNTDIDKIFIYRQGKLTAESAVSQALSGRFF